MSVPTSPRDPSSSQTQTLSVSDPTTQSSPYSHGATAWYQLLLKGFHHASDTISSAFSRVEHRSQSQAFQMTPLGTAPAPVSCPSPNASTTSLASTASTIAPSTSTTNGSSSGSLVGTSSYSSMLSFLTAGTSPQAPNPPTQVPPTWRDNTVYKFLAEALSAFKHPVVITIATIWAAVMATTLFGPQLQQSELAKWSASNEAFNTCMELKEKGADLSTYCLTRLEQGFIPPPLRRSSDSTSVEPEFDPVWQAIGIVVNVTWVGGYVLLFGVLIFRNYVGKPSDHVQQANLPEESFSLLEIDSIPREGSMYSAAELSEDRRPDRHRELFAAKENLLRANTVPVKKKVPPMSVLDVVGRRAFVRDDVV